MIMSNKITIDDFLKLDLRVGKILEARAVEDSRKMIELKIDIGEKELKTVFAGIKKSYNPENLINKLAVVIVNLEPREMKFGTSEGMILAAQDDDVVILQPEKEIKPGSKIS
tara:strand:+ start:3927 stop:4262 length:336 start_codon:yes stop_codon:yes gene_type:complete